MSGEPDPRPRRPWRRALLAVLVAAAAAGGWAASRALAGPGRADAGTVPTSSAAVVRTSLSTTTQLTGTLGYTGSYQVVNQLTGAAITALPRLGRVIRRGQAAFEVDGTGVPLFYGSRPLWRAIQPGITPGADVSELDRNLIALGYTDYGALTASDTFTSATAAAIDEWQAARGLTQTGSVQAGDVVFEPGPVRVTTRAVPPGTPAQPGTVVLDATSTRRNVTVAVPVVQEYLLKKGDRVTVTLPNGTTTTPGVVASIAPVASAATSSGSGSGNSGGATAGTGSGAGQGGGDTVTVSVRLTRPAAAGRFDQAPVEVNIVNATADGVLAVPVNALVALSGGGYGIEVTGGRQRTLVPVRTGLFASTMVQVSAAGLRAGTRVEVPAG
jgi:hypothetical protein